MTPAEERELINKALTVVGCVAVAGFLVLVIAFREVFP